MRTKKEYEDILMKITEEVIRVNSDSMDNMRKIFGEFDFTVSPGFDFNSGRKDATNRLFEVLSDFYGDEFDYIYNTTYDKLHGGGDNKNGQN